VPNKKSGIKVRIAYEIIYLASTRVNNTIYKILSHINADVAPPTNVTLGIFYFFK